MRTTFLIFLFLIAKIGQTQTLKTYTQDTLLMGSAFVFTAINMDANKARQAVKAGIQEVIRIEKIISSWNPNSETSSINLHAGIKPVNVSGELLQLIERSLKISKLSNGNFDISFASMDKVWSFNQREIDSIPSDEVIKNSVAKIDYQNIEVNPTEETVFLKEKGMKIGFGAIGKGYAADMAKKKMIASGASSGVVNAGGDLISWGLKIDNTPWTIGIANPKNKLEVALSLNVSNTALVTSGNYEKYFLYEGEKYCHIINPLTGWPVGGTQSVTIISPSAEFSDALATTVFVLGKDEGIQLINHLQGVEGIIIDHQGNITYSENIQTKILQ